MFKHAAICAAMAFALASGAAQALSVVDTGTPESTFGWAFNKDQFFAGEFSLLSDSVIDGIQGYFGTEAGTVTFSLFSDGGDLPGSLLYSTSLNTTAGDTTWNGVSGLNWAVTAGTYWAAFTPSFSSPYASIPGNVAEPLAAYATNHGYGWEVPVQDINVAMRIDTLAPVPEPTTISLYALGLAGLAMAARRRKV